MPTSKNLSLHGKVALVTGSLGLLGRQHCEALAEAGAQVIVSDTDQEGCLEFAEELNDRFEQKEPSGALGMAFDVTQPESIDQALGAILDSRGRVDVLVNNAALNDKVEGRDDEAIPFEEFPLEEWKLALDVNITGVFLCCQRFGRPMKEQGSGSIINIASTYGMVSPDQSLYQDRTGRQKLYKSAAYPTTKAAVLNLTRYLATYWGRHGVRVNALSPGGVENGQDAEFVERYQNRTPLGRMANRDDYRGALLFLAGEHSSYMTGANLVVDGGFTAW